MHSSIDQVPILPVENEPLLSKDERVFNILTKLAGTHFDRNSFLSPAQYDPDNSFHQLKTTFIEADTSHDITETAQLAEIFYPGFRETIVNSFLDHPELLEQIAAEIEAGRNISVVTAHESLMDIILVTFGLNLALLESGLIEDEKEQINNTHIIIGRTILCMEVGDEKESTPVVELIRRLNNLHIALPLSSKITKAIDLDTIENNNFAMMRGFMKFYPKKNDSKSEKCRGKILGCAAPGTVDVPEIDTEGNLKAVHIRPVPQGMTKIIKRVGLMLPVTAVLSGEKQCCIPSSKLIQLKNPEQVHEIIYAIAGMREQETGTKTTYGLF